MVLSLSAMITSWFQQTSGLDPNLQSRLVRSIALILIVWAVWWVLIRFGIRHIDDAAVRYRTRKAAGYVVTSLAFILIGRVWFQGVTPLTTYLGLLSAGLAVALQSPIVSFAGWLFILWRRPFELGDRIQVGEHAGDVIDLRIFQFTLLEIGNWVDADQTTGRVIQVPNSAVFSQPLANYNKRADFIWNEIPVQITFESDWRLAKKLLNEIIHKRSEKIGVRAREELRRTAGEFWMGTVDVEPHVFTSVDQFGVLLTMRYVCDPRRRRSSAEAIWEDVLTALAQEDSIAFAYPTQRNFDNRLEGKPGTVTTRLAETKADRSA